MLGTINYIHCFLDSSHFILFHFISFKLATVSAGIAVPASLVTVATEDPEKKAIITKVLGAIK